MYKKSILTFVLLILYMVLVPTRVFASKSSDEPALSSEILSFDQKNLPKLNESKDNPFITIYDAYIVVSWNKGKKFKEVQPAELGHVLSQIPASAWPYGRAVGVTYCGVGSAAQSAKKYRQDAWKSVEKTLKRMKIYLNPWPCA